MRIQLRPFYPADELADIYRRTYRHGLWPEHVSRVRHTAGLLRGMQPQSVADLSCGDGQLVAQAGLTQVAQLGDLTPGWPYCGPIEQTIEQIEPVDVFVCSETLEHVEDPDAVLRAIRAKAARLLLTTPIGEDTDRNPEHYWGWAIEDVRVMLHDAGWSGDVEQLAIGPRPYYTYQIWRCS